MTWSQWVWRLICSEGQPIRAYRAQWGVVYGALVARVGVARRKTWPAVEKCLLKFSIIVDLSVVTVLPSLGAVGSWEDVFLFSMDFTVPQNFLELELQDANFCLNKLAFAFLTDCVYWFLTSLSSCISRGLFDAIAVCHRMFLCWSRAVRSGVNQGLYLFLVQHFLKFEICVRLRASSLDCWTALATATVKHIPV